MAAGLVFQHVGLIRVEVKGMFSWGEGIQPLGKNGGGFGDQNNFSSSISTLRDLSPWGQYQNWYEGELQWFIEKQYKILCGGFRFSIS